jgi:hypothetical protein
MAVDSGMVYLCLLTSKNAPLGDAFKGSVLLDRPPFYFILFIDDFMPDPGLNKSNRPALKIGRHEKKKERESSALLNKSLEQGLNLSGS